MRQERAGAHAAIFAFAFALSIATVAMPLAGIAAGHSPALVGLLIGLSGLTQFVVRMGLGILLRVVPDRTVIIAAGTALAASSFVVAASAALVPFLIGQVLQGAARACFWTASQTHAARRHTHTVTAIARINVTAALATLCGPFVAGVLAARGATAALLAAGGAALAAALFTLFLDRLPPFDFAPGTVPKRIWRRPGVSHGCLMSLTTGAWRGLLGSYVPIVLAAADQSTTRIGALVSLANGAVLVGSGLLARERATTGWAVASAVVASGAGLALTGLTAGVLPAAAAGLVLSGLGAGLLQTLGPAVAADTVRPEEVGEAIVATGTFRAGALFAAPLGVSGALTLFGLTAATGMTIVGLLIALPAWMTRHLPKEA